MEKRTENQPRQSYPATKAVCQLDENGFFLGEAFADLSPEEEGVYLLPGGCIDQVAPENRVGFIAKWTGESWQYVENHLGKMIYSTKDQSRIRVETLGALPEGYTLIAPTSPLAHWDGTQWALSKEASQTLIAEHKARLITQIAEKTDHLKELVLVGYPQAEIDSFYRQEKEARAWLLDNTAPTEMLSAIATTRGVPLAVLAEKVVEKADAVSAIMGQIIGKRQYFEDRIDIATELDQLKALEEGIAQWQLPSR